MPRRSKGPRLWLQQARRDKQTGQVAEQAVWCILDGKVKRSTGCGPSKIKEAERALTAYLLEKATPRPRDRDPTVIPIADVVAIYIEDVVEKHGRPKETAARLDRILDHFGDKMLGNLNKATCDAYVKVRGHVAAARRELEDLRAAIRHHWKTGLCSALTPIVLPERGEARTRFLTRSEAARLLWAAWRLRQSQHGRMTERPIAQHVARFILAGLYTGTRSAAICGAALQPTEGRG